MFEYFFCGISWQSTYGFKLGILILNIISEIKKIYRLEERKLFVVQKMVSSYDLHVRYSLPFLRKRGFF